jgi:uncharacterized membrane protein
VWSNFWALPCAMIVAAISAASLLLVLDARGASAWVASFGWPFAMSGSTAQDLASSLVTVHAAFSTLYFSITLLVLTLAASNLGVRLIDRWIGDPVIRFTLGLLLSLLAAALILHFSINSADPPDRVPRLTTTILVVGTIAALAWMTNALHHLGRMVHIDTSIARLGQDAAESLGGTFYLGPPIVDMETGVAIISRETGYIDEIALDAMLCEACERGAFVRLDHARGDFVMKGEPVGLVVGAASGDWVVRHITFAPYRNDTRGPEFECNLLVEIAARALSPGINDPYSALACCDRLAGVLAAAVEEQQRARWLTDAQGMPRLEMPRERITQFMDRPLKSLRHSVASYPSVTVHMIDLIARLPQPARMDADLRLFLLENVEALAEHGCIRADLERDRTDIAAALAKARSHLR